LNKPLPTSRRTAGFTLVEVMMAAVILVVGLIGLIEAVAISASAMDQARRATLATQIISHEIEKLYFSSWSTISGLPTASTAITIDSQFDQARLALGDDKTGTAVVRFSMTRTVTSPDPVTNIREVNFTVTWVVTSSRLDAGGSRVAFTYTRANSAWFGKYGLPLSYSQS
jgi:Tfp pilus assembly protein PilV